MTERLKAQSGHYCWQNRLQDAYSLFSDWAAQDEEHGFAVRLGFADAREAWEFNPFVRGTDRPEDFCRAYEVADFPTEISVFVEMKVEIAFEDEFEKEGNSIHPATLPAWKIQEAAQQAVENALKMCHDHGFTHSHEDRLSLGLVAVEVSEEILDMRSPVK